VGWMEEEFRALNVAFSDRGPLSDETVAVMKEVWTSDNPRFAGRFHQFSDLRCEPRPVQKPTLQSGWADTLALRLRRVAEYGDGWAAVVFSPQEFSERLDKLKEKAAKIGRDLSTITLCVSPRGKRPETMIEDIPRYQELGQPISILLFSISPALPRNGADDGTVCTRCTINLMRWRAVIKGLGQMLREEIPRNIQKVPARRPWR